MASAATRLTAGVFVVLVALSVALLVALGGVFHDSGKGPSPQAPPMPPPDHPRLLVRPADLPQMRQRFRAPESAELRERILQQASAASDGRLPDGVPEDLRADVRRRAYEAKALLYLLEGDEETGRDAIRMAREYLRSHTGTHEEGGLRVSRAANRALFGAAMVYDWCYALLGEDEKAALIEQILRIASNTEYGWPVERPGYVAGHYAEEKHPSMLAVGIAVYDEDPSIYEAMAGQFYEGFAPIRNFFYPGGRHHQGSSYGASRFRHEVTASFLMTRMGVENPCVDAQATIPYSFIYMRRPDDLLMVEGDDYARAAGPGWPAIGAPLHMLVSMYADPYIQDEALRYAPHPADAALFFLARDDSVDRRPVSELPLTRYFGSPFGHMIARTGWDVQAGKSSPVVVAKMGISEWQFGNHQHLDAGHFSIYYKGSLAIDSGGYGGTRGGYGSAHFLNYLQRTVAHNTLLVLDPDEPKPVWWTDEVESRDGGQFWPGELGFGWPDLEKMLLRGSRGEILAHEFGPDPRVPDYSYLKGDIARAYHSPERYPPKVSEVKRSFVFLNLSDEAHPAALVVFDRVDARKPEFRKSWLLHSINEPRLTGGLTTIDRTEDGYNGRLVNSTLLPPEGNREIIAIGGPGREFWVDGRNYPQSYDRPGSHEPGAWRIELSPAQPSYTDVFLNVLQVMDAEGGPPPLPAGLLESDWFVGATISDRAVFFSRTGQRVESPFVLQLPENDGEWRCLITDVAPGRWRVEGAGVRDLNATEEGGCLYLRAAPGALSLSPR